jgi:hypothetical protein
MFLSEKTVVAQILRNSPCSVQAACSLPYQKSPPLVSVLSLRLYHYLLFRTDVRVFQVTDAMICFIVRLVGSVHEGLLTGPSSVSCPVPANTIYCNSEND